MTKPGTIDLLRSWHAGSRTALEDLLARHLPWIRDYVRRRLGEKLRARDETLDLVQEAVVDVLEYGPRFEITDEGCFRSLLARIVENNIRDRDKYLNRACRDAGRERSGCTDSVLALDPPVDSVTNPSAKASAAETAEWVRLAIELLEPADREVVLLREWDGLTFTAIGQRLGIPENTARMRYQRALPKLAQKVTGLRSGAVRAVI